MTPEPAIDRRTSRLLRVASVLVPLSLLISGAAAAGAAVAVGQLRSERHDRCVASRTDTQAAIVAGMEAVGVRPQTQETVADAVARALPVDEC